MTEGSRKRVAARWCQRLTPASVKKPVLRRSYGKTSTHMAKKFDPKITTEWLRANDPKLMGRRKGPRWHPKPIVGMNGKCPRDIRMGEYRPESVKDFTKRHRDAKSDDCIFVPGALDGVPASVRFCDRDITAARYMLLLTRGAPKSGGMVTRHVCGNGHLSCINPNHLVWGTQADNIGDMTRHRHAGDDAQDKIKAILGE